MLDAMSKLRSTHVVGGLVAAVAAGYVFLELNSFGDLLLFEDTTPNGGDTGAHVWWPAFMRDHVFPDLRLSGWAPDWYAGFPVGHFYFPIPALLIVALDLVLPYNVAFKLVTALGPVLLPVAAYTFGRAIRAPWPAPPLMAVATLPFLYFTGYTIYGGNLPSTLAGEFAFSIGLAVALLTLAALARSLDDGRRPWLPALLLALTVLTHIIAGVFAVVGGVVVWLARRPLRTFPVVVAIGGVAFLLAAIWVVPMVGRLAYATDMGWGKVTEIRENLLHEDLRWAVVLAGVGLVVGAAYLRRATLELTALAATFAAMFWLWPEGRLWNARLLPFYYLPLLFLAAIGVAEVVNLVRRVVESPRAVTWAAARARDEAGARPAPPSPPQGDLVSTVEDRAARQRARRRLGLVSVALAHGVAVLGLVVGLVYVGDDDVHDFIPGWIEWNNTGYEAKAAYPEYREIMDTLEALPPGRLLWERLERINDYGSDLALELIPYFTDGDVGSMEGLYFESASTTPFHFLTVAEVASQPSNPVRGLDYGSIETDFDRGVRHLELMGVRYYMAGSEQAKERASEHPGLALVTEIGEPDREPSVARWAIYEVAGAEVVEPVAFEPVVVEGLGDAELFPWQRGLDQDEWLPMAQDWFHDESQLERPLAGDGPDRWARVGEARAASAPFEELPEVDVDDVSVGTDRVEFRVSETGVPVLVKVSYFPNWQVDGAEGPWRVTPNFMVVVPTEEHVELTYGRTPLDRLGIALTVVGAVGLVALGRWRPRSRDARAEAVRAERGVSS